MPANSKDPVQSHLELLASRNAAKQKEKEDRQAFEPVRFALNKCQNEDLTKKLLPNVYSGVEPEKWKEKMPWTKFSRVFVSEYIVPALSCVNQWVAENDVDLSKIPAERWSNSQGDFRERVLVMKGLVWPLLSPDVWSESGHLKEPVRKEFTANLEALLRADALCLSQYLHFFGVFRVALWKAPSESEEVTALRAVLGAASRCVELSSNSTPLNARKDVQFLEDAGGYFVTLAPIRSRWKGEPADWEKVAHSLKGHGLHRPNGRIWYQVSDLIAAFEAHAQAEPLDPDGARSEYGHLRNSIAGMEVRSKLRALLQARHELVGTSQD